MYENILVSVIIPTYNVDKFIKEAIDSIINQSYKNLEIIIVDDCSVDDTFRILKDCESIDKRIRIFRNDINSGISYTLNQALKHAKGEYIARMDGDDISLLNRISSQVNYLESNPNMDLIGTNIIKIDENGSSLSRNSRIIDPDLINKTLLISSPLAHPTWLGRRGVFTHLKGYRNVAPAEDYDFLLRLTSFGYKFTNINVDGLKLRIREGNTTSSQGLKQRKAVNYVLKMHKERLNSGQDSYSRECFQKYTNSNLVIKKAHYASQIFYDNAVINFHSGKTLLSMLYFGVSILLSPYQAQFLFRWVRLKYILRRF